jgi:hypothetical protein
MAIALTTITNSIAAVSVSGVAMKALSDIQVTVDSRAVIFQPEPVEFMSNVAVTVAANQGSNGTSPSYNVEYDLKYALFYAPLGASRHLESFGEALAKALTVADAILTTLVYSGAVTIKLGGISTPGPIVDPAGNSFFGCYVTLHVLEFVN